ncbi:hypothetical protein BC936DRAFT_138789, partial [Jimgerdemannia flammicorona]
MVVGTLGQFASDSRASVCILGPTIATCIFLLYLTYRAYAGKKKVLGLYRPFLSSQQVISERSSNGLKTYWEEVIYDRKKVGQNISYWFCSCQDARMPITSIIMQNRLAVKYTHIIGSLDLLDKAGKHNTKDLLSKDSSNPFLVSTTIAKNSVEEDAGGEGKMSDQDYEYTDAQCNIDDLKSKGMLNARKHGLDGDKTCQLRKK